MFQTSWVLVVLQIELIKSIDDLHQTGIFTILFGALALRPSARKCKSLDELSVS